jgi:hypothetical protein
MANRAPNGSTEKGMTSGASGVREAVSWAAAGSTQHVSSRSEEIAFFEHANQARADSGLRTYTPAIWTSQECITNISNFYFNNLF